VESNRNVNFDLMKLDSLSDVESNRNVNFDLMKLDSLSDVESNRNVNFDLMKLDVSEVAAAVDKQSQKCKNM